MKKTSDNPDNVTWQYLFFLMKVYFQYLSFEDSGWSYRVPFCLQRTLLLFSRHRLNIVRKQPAPLVALGVLLRAPCRSGNPNVQQRSIYFNLSRAHG